MKTAETYKEFIREFCRSLDRSAIEVKDMVVLDPGKVIQKSIDRELTLDGAASFNFPLAGIGRKIKGFEVNTYRMYSKNFHFVSQVPKERKYVTEILLNLETMINSGGFIYKYGEERRMRSSRKIILSGKKAEVLKKFNLAEIESAIEYELDD